MTARHSAAHGRKPAEVGNSQAEQESVNARTSVDARKSAGAQEAIDAQKSVDARETADARETPAEPEPSARARETQTEQPAGTGGQPEQYSAAELLDRWRRAVADLDNARKRFARQLAEEQAEERARVTAAWLPVIDNLELALAHANADAKSIVEGVRAIRDQSIALVAALGYTRHAETGVPFDPQRHDAVSVVSDTEADPGTVVEVIRPGYGDGKTMLRPAAVVVAAMNAGQAATNAESTTPATTQGHASTAVEDEHAPTAVEDEEAEHGPAKAVGSREARSTDRSAADQQSADRAATDEVG